MNRLALSSASFAVLFSLPVDAAALQAHRAYYDLTAKSIEAGNNITTVSGKLAYEITGSTCEGYAVSYRVANRIVFTEGGPQVSDTQLTTWESGDGLEFNLTQKQFIDSKLSSESRIKVTKDTETLPGQGEITTGKPRQFTIPGAAIFPTRFQEKLIEAANKGESRDVSLVYEGSEEEKPLRVISFIGSKRPESGIPEKIGGEMSKAPVWPMSVSYYQDEAKSDAQPVYQASFLMLENGITTDLVLDYGTYVLDGKLTKLELLKDSKCP